MEKAVHLTCAYWENPLGLGEKKPCFGWILASTKRDVKQKSYHIQVSKKEDFSSVIWDSGVVLSDNSVNIPYEGEELESAAVYFWRVFVEDNHGIYGGWSDSARFEMGLLHPDDWKGDFISSETDEDWDSSKGWLLRRSFTLADRPERARIYATALGIYEIFINGVRVGDTLLTPGWTEYAKRLLHQTYDVTELLQKGDNTLGISLGVGWYKGDLLWEGGNRNFFGKSTAALVQMEADLKNGEKAVVFTDKNWKCGKSPVLYSELYHGEIYDAREEPDGWSCPDFDDSGWSEANVCSISKDKVIPQDGEFIRRREILPVREMIITPKGETVMDFGQNIAGWVRFKVCGKAGDRLVLNHAEVLDQDGNFYTENLRSAKAEISYTLRGTHAGKKEIYEPHFTFQGFRYVCVKEGVDLFSPENFEAVVIHSDMPEIGSFHCSDSMLEQLHHNILWGLKGNFVDICTDCPQRDERLGWTGDAQVFGRTATYLMDTRAFFRKWLRDVQAAQLADGGIPHVIPDVLTPAEDKERPMTPDVPAERKEKTSYAACGWGDAATILPWTVYQAYGDKEALREYYPMMKKWVEYIRRVATDGVLWDSGSHFGDWVALDAQEGSYHGATPNELTATAYYAYSTELVKKSAQVLGYDEDARFYGGLREKIGEAYVKRFYTAEGEICHRTQTSQILTLAFGLAPDRYRKNTVKTLLALLDKHDGHLVTGFLGTPYFCRVLAENGELDAAYALLLKKDYPSWLYPITKGATTIWEHWDGIKPDGSMWSADMNSFNHYAYGAIGDWMYKTVAGIDTDPEKPGYKNIIFRPRPGGDIRSAGASVETPYGKAAISWEKEKDSLSVEVEIPANTTADIYLPLKKGQKISMDDAQINSAGEKEEEVVALGSGKYHLAVK